MTTTTRNERYLFWAVLSISTITILSSTAVSPALAGIQAAFPDMADETIQLILTIPPLCIIPTCFLCGPLSERIGRKRVLLLGITLYLIGGLGAALMPTFNLMLAARGLLGVGCGFITPLAQALISANFSGKIREQMMGYSASASYLMGILASFVVSNMAAIHWRLSFCVYLVALVVLILNLRYLPWDDGAKLRTQPAERARIPWRAIPVMVAMGLINVAFYTFSVSIALFMSQEGIGGASSSGIVVAVFMLVGFCVGLVTAKIRALAGRLTNAVGAVMMGLGYLILCTATSMPLLCLGAAGIGGSYSIFYSSVFLKISQLSRSQRENTRLVTYTTAALFLGQAVSAVLLRGVEALFGQSGYRFRFLFLALTLLLAAVIIAVWAFYQRRNSHEHADR